MFVTRCFYYTGITCLKQIKNINSALKKNDHQFLYTLLSPCRTFSSSMYFLNRSKVPMLDSIYSEDAKKDILHRLNTLTKDELALRKVSSTRQRQICEHKPYIHLTDVLKIPKMDVVKAERLFRSLLKEVIPKKNGIHKQQKLDNISPPLDQAMATNIKTITAVDIGTGYSHYVTMSSDWSILDLAQVQMGGSGLKAHIQTYNQHAYLEEVRHLLNLVPTSDVYLLNGRRKRIGANTNARNMFPYYSNVLLQAIFSAFIRAQSDKQKVFLIPEHDVVRKFSLRVGDERVSSTRMVADIMANQRYKDHTLTNIDILKIRMNQIVKPEQKEKANFLFLTSLHFITNILYPVLEGPGMETGSSNEGLDIGSSYKELETGSSNEELVTRASDEELVTRSSNEELVTRSSNEELKSRTSNKELETGSSNEGLTIESSNDNYCIGSCNEVLETRSSYGELVTRSSDDELKCGTYNVELDIGSYNEELESKSFYDELLVTRSADDELESGTYNEELEIEFIEKMENGSSN